MVPDRPDGMESTEPVLRVPRPEDLDAIVRIDEAWTGEPRPTYLGSRLGRTQHGAGIDLSRVAERDGEVVGYLFGEVTRGEFGRVFPVAWVDTIGVRKDQVRGGVGSALLQEFMRHARAAGARRVWTLLEPEAGGLADFLQAHGFHVAKAKLVEQVLDGGS